jgi:hypothetical protein
MTHAVRPREKFLRGGHEVGLLAHRGDEPRGDLRLLLGEPEALVEDVVGVGLQRERRRAAFAEAQVNVALGGACTDRDDDTRRALLQWDVVVPERCAALVLRAPGVALKPVETASTRRDVGRVHLLRLLDAALVDFHGGSGCSGEYHDGVDCPDGLDEVFELECFRPIDAANDHVLGRVGPVEAQEPLRSGVVHVLDDQRRGAHFFPFFGGNGFGADFFSPGAGFSGFLDRNGGGDFFMVALSVPALHFAADETNRDVGTSGHTTSGHGDDAHPLAEVTAEDGVRGERGHISSGHGGDAGHLREPGH